VVDAAPMFDERLALNRAAVVARRPMVECAVYAFEAHVTTFIPGRTGCLQCLVPEVPPEWKRHFPVLGAVSGTAGCLGAVEVVKLLTGLGEPLAGTRLVMDLGTMQFRRLNAPRPAAHRAVRAARGEPTRASRMSALRAVHAGAKPNHFAALPPSTFDRALGVRKFSSAASRSRSRR
jgi:hypothetical protein